MVTRKSYQRGSNRGNSDYIKNCDKGWPKRVYWTVIAGNKLTYAQESDLLFDERDYKIRGLPIPK
jgi:hypothetical protein